MTGPAVVAVLRLGLASAAVATLGACRADQTPELFGTWQAEVLIEDGDTVDVDLENVSLAFAPDLNYLYTSTLDYVEPGTYRLDGGVLYTLPEGSDAGAARKVKVELLDSARLHILMNDAGKLRRLEFARVARDAAVVDTFGRGGDGAYDIDTAYYPLDSGSLDGPQYDDGHFDDGHGHPDDGHGH